MNQTWQQLTLGYLISSGLTVALQIIALYLGGYHTAFHWQPIALMLLGSLAAWWFIITIANRYNKPNKS